MAVPGHVAGATGAGGRRGRGNAGAGCRQRSPVLASAKPGTSALGGAPWIHYFIPATEGKLSWERPGDLERPRGPVGQAGPATDLLRCSRTSFDVPPRGDQADEPIAEPRGRTFGKKPRCRVRWRSVHGHVADPSHPRSLIPPPGGSAPVFAWPVPLHPQVSGQPVGGRVSTNPSVGVCVATAEGGSGGDAPLQVSPGPALCLHTTGTR